MKVRKSILQAALVSGLTIVVFAVVTGRAGNLEPNAPPAPLTQSRFTAIHSGGSAFTPL